MGKHLALELLDDHGGAPSALFLASQDVAVTMVSDVQYLVAGCAECPLKIVQIASLVDIASFEREPGRLHRVAVALVCALHDGPVLLKECGFGRRDDDNVEVVSPVRV